MSAVATERAPDALAALRPRRVDRAILIGKTGTGKTTLARYLLAPYPYVVVHDAKGYLAWPGYRVCRTMADVTRRREPRIIYRPTAEELRDPKKAQAFFNWVYLRKHCVCYVDEAYAVVHGTQLPPAYHACLTRGRERGVGIWSSTQRPSRIPQVILSESEHAYLFRLRLERDKKRMAEEWGFGIERQSQLGEHDFLYATERAPQPRGPLRLDL